MRLNLTFGLLLFSLLSLPIYSQTISGTVCFAANGKPMEYASIGIINTSIGMLTSENGRFCLNVKGQSLQSFVRFSMMGYKAQTFTVEELLKKETDVKLVAEPVLLSEVIVHPSGKQRKVGTTNFTWLGSLCGWKVDANQIERAVMGNGFEIGTKIELGPKLVKVKSVHIHIDKQSFDTTLVRLHVHQIINDEAEEDLLSNSIDSSGDTARIGMADGLEGQA